jgi:hypothetical protein
MKPIKITYLFDFEDKSKEKIDISLNRQTLVSESKTGKPKKWTELGFCQCENCLLKKAEAPHCPIALNLDGIIEKFKKRKSYEMVLVRVETEERIYEKKVALQQGLGSLIGIIMVTSGCPTMDILQPMVRFHLPFATVEETIFRAASFYMLGQYFRHQRKKSVDLDLDGLLKGYQDIQKVNIGITDRLRSSSDIDAGTNAVVLLDIFAKTLPTSILDGLMDIEYIFRPLLASDTD